MRLARQEWSSQIRPSLTTVPQNQNRVLYCEIKSAHAAASTHDRMDRLRHLCHDPPFWLVIHPRVDHWRSTLTFSVPCVNTHVDWHVDHLGRNHFALAAASALPNGVDVGSCVCAFHRRLLDLQEFGKAFQRRPAGRCSRSCSRASGTAIGDHWHPGSRSPPGLPGPLMRDAGLEPWERSGGLLRLDGVRCNLRFHHDPTGRRRT